MKIRVGKVTSSNLGGGSLETYIMAPFSLLKHPNICFGSIGPSYLGNFGVSSQKNSTVFLELFLASIVVQFLTLKVFGGPSSYLGEPCVSFCSCVLHRISLKSFC